MFLRSPFRAKKFLGLCFENQNCYLVEASQRKKQIHCSNAYTFRLQDGAMQAGKIMDWGIVEAQLKAFVRLHFRKPPPTSFCIPGAMAIFGKLVLPSEFTHAEILTEIVCDLEKEWQPKDCSIDYHATSQHTALAVNYAVTHQHDLNLLREHITAAGLTLTHIFVDVYTLKALCHRLAIQAEILLHANNDIITLAVFNHDAELIFYQQWQTDHETLFASIDDYLKRYRLRVAYLLPVVLQAKLVPSLAIKYQLSSIAARCEEVYKIPHDYVQAWSVALAGLA